MNKYPYYTILIELDSLILEAIDCGLDFYDTYQLTIEMKKESCIIQIMYKIPYNNANLIVSHCHALNYPVPTLTPKELSLALNIPVDEIHNILESIDNFMNQNPSNQEIQNFVEETKYKYFPVKFY